MENRELCLGYGSAIELWRQARRRVAAQNPADLLVRLLFDWNPHVRLDALPAAVSTSLMPTHLAGRLVLPARGALGTARPSLDCVVSSRGGRERRHGVACHLLSGPYPEGSICRDPETGLLVTGVPLTLLQLADRLDDVAMLELISELMGFFVIDDASETGLRHGPPLVTAAGIRDWVRAARGLRSREGLRMPHGTGRLLSLVELAVERAASPGEVRSSLLLSLPLARGGYGLQGPCLNVLTPLSASDAATYGVEGYVCDLTWADRRTMVEYRGELVHKQRATKLSDARKGNILNHIGYEVLILEKCQLSKIDLMNERARMLAERLGVAFVLGGREAMTQRLQLRRDLLGRWVEP